MTSRFRLRRLRQAKGDRADSGPGGRVLVAIIAGLLCLSAPLARATEVTVQNDSAADGPQTTVCTCFIPGDEVASWLTSPCDGDIVAVQVLWRSQFSGAPTTQETAIRIYDAGAFPTPGAVLTNQGAVPAVIQAPILADSLSVNEYRHLDQAMTTPLSVPVSNGQAVAVSLEIFNQSSGNVFAPSAVYDLDGCQASLNGVLTTPPGTWTDACLLGVTGDWVIRAVVDCGPTTVPTVSEWGVLAAVLLVLIAGTLALGHPRRVRA